MIPSTHPVATIFKAWKARSTPSATWMPRITEWGVILTIRSMIPITAKSSQIPPIANPGA
jgi:hypothetical protein